jgi:hypothetical protein
MRDGWYRLAPIAGAFVLGLAACSSYVTTVQPVEDEILVKLVADPLVAYDHPVRLTVQDLTAILQHVRVEYKAGWLQNYLTGPLKALPLFDPQSLARVVPPLVRAFEEANPHDRIVFYIADRRTNMRREVTSGTLFVTGQLMHISLSNFRNGVDVIPGVPAYDRDSPEIAVAPQRFSVMFEPAEFVFDHKPGFVQEVFGAIPPSLLVDYRLFLNSVSRHADLGSSPAKAIPSP